jgi:hypothetical protein
MNRAWPSPLKGPGWISGCQGLTFEDLPTVPHHVGGCWQGRARPWGQFMPAQVVYSAAGGGAGGEPGRDHDPQPGVEPERSQVEQFVMQRAQGQAVIESIWLVEGEPPHMRRLNPPPWPRRTARLDMTESAALDFYLVLTGPRAAAVSTRSSTRPWHIDAVYLFHAADLLEHQHARNIKIGVATSVLNSQRENAEIFPKPRNPLLPLSPAQASLLRLFADPGESEAGGEDSETSGARD